MKNHLRLAFPTNFAKGVWALALLSGASVASAKTLGSIEFKPCELNANGRVPSIYVQCAEQAVPENPKLPGGRQIKLALAWIPATSDAKADPLVFIAGGPGQSAIESYPAMHSLFAPITKERDIILIDQRGTGNSNRLACPNMDNAALADIEDVSDTDTVQMAKDCAESLGKIADLRFYTTTDAIADIELVRKKIGASKLNLYGVSYGTRVAQQFAKTYPQSVRSLVLDGIVPNSWAAFSDSAKASDSAWRANFARCTANKACFARYGDLTQRLRDFQSGLKIQPLIVKLPHPTTGLMVEEKLTAGKLAGIVHMHGYSPLTLSLVPSLLMQAIEGNPVPLVAQSLLIDRNMGEFPIGMRMSVLCPEDMAGATLDPSNEDTLLGNESSKTMQAQCAIWPQNPRPANFRDPLKGNVPTLILSGEFDPITPPRFGDEIKAHLSNARHLIFKGQGHNVMPAGCGPTLFAKFIETADPGKLDVKCLEHLRALPHFTTPFGWEP